MYRRAQHRFPATIDGVPALRLPDACPVSLADLLGDDPPA
jgi:hypothetical protein